MCRPPSTGNIASKTTQHMEVSMISFLIFNAHRMGTWAHGMVCAAVFSTLKRMVYFSLLTFDFKFIAVSRALFIFCALFRNGKKNQLKYNNNN